MDINEMADMMLEILPPDGSAMNSVSARQELGKLVKREIGEAEFEMVRDLSLMIGTIKWGCNQERSIALSEALEHGGKNIPCHPAKPDSDDSEKMSQNYQSDDPIKLESQTSTKQDEPLILDRKSIRSGKYTKWAIDLSSDQLLALLWMVGEYGIRSSLEKPEIFYGNQGRRETARRALIEFVRGKKLTLEAAKKALRSSC